MSRIPSAFCGVIAELPGISIDNFEDENKNCRAFFLSHCHTDHTKGLNNEEFLKILAANDKMYIYMSELTALIISETCDKCILKNIIVLKIGKTDIKLPAKGTWKEEYVTVSVIPAGHCTGSVMFLFNTSNGKNILYTGDFRLSVNDGDKLSQLHRADGDPITIDVMYVDTTFIEKEYLNFPKRSECFAELINHITSWLVEDKDNAVALAPSARFGYEWLFLEISNKLGIKIYVNNEKQRIYSKHKTLAAILEKNGSKPRIHVCCNRHSTKNHVSNCGLTEESKKYLFIKFSAMCWEYFELETAALTRKGNDIKVCYSTHCSRTELREFVNYYAPKKVVGFPNPYDFCHQNSVIKEPANTKSYTTVRTRPSFVSPSKRSPCIRKCKKIKKVDESILRKLFYDT